MSSPETRKGIPLVAKIGAGLGAAALAGGIALGVAGNKEQPRPVATERPSAAAASPTPKETATSTVKPTELTKPTEIPKVPCQVLPMEVCNSAELIHLKSSDGREFAYIAVNVPDQTPIFAPKDAQVAKAPIQQPATFRGFLIRIGEQNFDISKPTYFIRGDFRFDNMLTVNVKKGDAIGYVQNSGANNFGYNFLIGITTNGTDDENSLKELFPNAFTKAPKIVSFVSPANPALTTLDLFTDKK